MQEAYVALSHGSHALFRKLEFLGSCSFNLFMATASLGGVVIYEQLGQTEPFKLVAAISVVWALVVGAYFLTRHRGRLHLNFAEAEDALLAERIASGERALRTAAEAEPQQTSTRA